MKALSYLEFRSLSTNDKYKEYCTFLQRLIANKFAIIEKFYAQPFTPELITKYFEGWERLGFYNLYNFRNGIQFSEIRGLLCRYCEDNKTNIPLATFTPRTLDDFINDCKRAGIDLQFKNRAGNL